jgi:hypothetical protein
MNRLGGALGPRLLITSIFGRSTSWLLTFPWINHYIIALGWRLNNLEEWYNVVHHRSAHIIGPRTVKHCV